MPKKAILLLKHASPSNKASSIQSFFLRETSPVSPWCFGNRPEQRYVLDMCGRARLSSDVSEIKIAFRIPPDRPSPNFPPSWNVAPTDSLPVVRYDGKAGQRSLDLLRCTKEIARTLANTPRTLFSLNRPALAGV